ncbi:hypothetical protein [Leadbetterella sp. DM7]|uniref:hypothetical protein n=1 Tax=Leadbetterella sp. DM7 TaxID=3235085 RepID=UPI00349E68C5
MNRKEFIRQSAGAGMLLFSALGNKAWASGPVTELMKKLVEGNDRFIEDFLARGAEGPKQGGRNYGYNFAKLAAAYCHPESRYHHDERLVNAMKEISVHFLNALSPDGTMTAGNIESPPDTAFIMEPLCSGVHILNQSRQKSLDAVKASIKVPIEKVGGALAVGGVHTPNHRWEICAALAWINRLYPDKKYTNRIDEWLSEGIYMDEDGHYPERSMNYADVENRAFITLGHLLDRPALYEPVTKSLTMAWYYTEPNGELITFDSRRQDQYSSREIMVQYLHYRFLAIEKQNTLFSAITSFIETLPDFGKNVVDQCLYNFMADPVLARELPRPGALPVNFEKFFKTSSLVRIRREETALTLFGGNDLPLIIASGRSVSPNFFGYRKGVAALKYMRMSSRFFSMGYFRSEGISQENGKYVLYNKLQAPYYQPLKPGDRRKDGDYELTPSVDDRFWSKMSFDKRPADFKTLESRVVVSENNGEVTMDFEVTGAEGVAVTVQLCFDEGGELNGIQEGGSGAHFLPEGYGEFRRGKDRITFGPGVKKHEWTRGLEGEKYSVLNGNLNTPGHHVYLTGYTPFKHTLKIR